MVFSGIKTKKNAVSVIVPHAGWYFSGKIIFKTLLQLTEKPDLVIIIGGHLPPVSPVLYAPEDFFETPFGKVKSSVDFINNMMEITELEEDYSSDNSVEIVLPFIKYLFSSAELVWLRAGSGPEAIDLGTLIFEISKKMGLKTVVIGSTDLTHYGPGYRFTPRGHGEEALTWVKNTNDRRIIDKMINMDSSGVIDDADKHKSACSSGAAAAAIRFAELEGVQKGNVIDYATSYDITPSDSFVGYTGICYREI